MIRNFFLTYLPVLLVIGLVCTDAEAQYYNWHPLEGSGSAVERHENALVRAGDFFILIGGRGMKPVDLYNTQTQEWSHGAQPPFEIHHIQAVELDGLVYIVGALTGGWPYETPLSHILVYDREADTWAIGPEIPADRRRGASGAVVHDGKIYIVCGIINGHSSGWVTWLDEFDPETNEWRRLPDAPRARDHLHSAVIDDRLYVAAGRRSGDGSGFAATVRETDVYDFNTGEWTTLPSPEGDIPTERAGTSAAVYQGNLLIIGGESGSQEVAHNEVEMLDVSTGTWETLRPLLRGRHGTQAIYFDDMVIIGAGSGNRGGGPELTSFEIFSEEEHPEIPSNPLTRAEISTSTNRIVVSSTQNGGSEQVYLESHGGNQASLISYVQLDNTADFSLTLPMPAPFILAPGQRVAIEVTRTDNASAGSSAQLLIKALGVREPLSVDLRAEE